MKVEDIDLPYEYAENSRGGTLTFVGCFVGLSVILGLVSYFYHALPLWLVMAPVTFVAVRASLFLIIRNAVHEAVRDAAMDSRLDDHITAAVEENNEYVARHALTPDRFAAKMEGFD